MFHTTKFKIAVMSSCLLVMSAGSSLQAQTAKPAPVTRTVNASTPAATAPASVAPATGTEAASGTAVPLTEVEQLQVESTMKDYTIKQQQVQLLQLQLASVQQEITTIKTKYVAQVGTIKKAHGLSAAYSFNASTGTFMPPGKTTPEASPAATVPAPGKTGTK